MLLSSLITWCVRRGAGRGPERCRQTARQGSTQQISRYAALRLKHHASGSSKCSSAAGSCPKRFLRRSKTSDMDARNAAIWRPPSETVERRDRTHTPLCHLLFPHEPTYRLIRLRGRYASLESFQHTQQDYARSPAKEYPTPHHH